MSGTTVMEERAARLARRLRLTAEGADDFTELRVGLQRVLQEVVGFDAGAFGTVDPATVVHTSCVLTGFDADPARERMLFEAEYLVDDVNKYAALARAEAPAAALHGTTDGDRSRSSRFAMLASVGIADELRVMFRTQGAPWGSLSAYRLGGEPFTADDVALAATSSALVAELVRDHLVRSAASTPGSLADPPGVVVVGPAGSVEAMTGEAPRWLDAMTEADRLPAVVRSLVAASRTGRSSSARVPLGDGSWLALHASRLKQEGGAADGSVAVVIERPRPAELSEVIVAAYGLTARERDITAAVARGLTTVQIAGELGISGYTVQDHLKAIFAKVGVQTRGELNATLHFTHYEPRVEAAQLPGPYGWFLDHTEPTPA